MTYERAATAIHTAGLCEGCPEARDLLNRAYRIDNPEEPTQLVSESIRKHLAKSASVSFDFQVRKVEYYGRLNQERNCEGGIRSELQPRLENEPWIEQRGPEFMALLQEASDNFKERFPELVEERRFADCELKVRDMERIRNEIFGLQDGSD